MTNPIAIGPATASPSSQAISPAKTRAQGASDFALLLDDAANNREPRTNRLGASAPTPTATVQTIDLDARSEALGGLLALLDGIAQGIEDEQPFDPEALDSLAGLLDTVTDLLENGAVIDPDSPLLGRLEELALSLGLDAGDASGPHGSLELLSGLATRLGGELRETAPHLATALTDLARRLDAQIASIETALANAQPDASLRLKLVDSETRPSAAAAIDKSALETPVSDPSNPETTRQIGKPDLASEGGRTLAGTSNEAAARPTEAQTAAVSTAAAASSSAEASTDAPDGLTLPAGQNTQTTAAPGAMRPETAAYTRPEPRINIPHIAVEIARSIQNGVSRFEVRLNPPELGRIDVRLEMDGAGNVTARLAVEKSETLDLLQRDQRALEKALADAGLDGSKTELEFALHDGSEGQDEPREREKWTASIATEPEAADTTPPPPGNTMRGYARLDAVNLWV